MSFLIPLSDLDYGAEEAAAVRRVLEGKWLSMGPETGAFEQEFATAVGVPHACAVSSGTAALHLAFLALGLGPGDEVIQPAVNFVASANMTRAVGATPVFGEIAGLDAPTLDPAEIERLITPHTKAVVVMHYGGYFCRIVEIQELCRKHHLALIEDACHAVGATCPLTSGSVAAGALGDIGCFSFFSNKNLVTGEGGMVTTNRDDLVEKVRKLRSHGMSTLTWDRHRGHAATYDVLAHGYNYRIDDLRSALGREQLKKLERNNQRRRELTTRYWQKLQLLETRGWVLPFRKVAALDSAACHLLPVVALDGETRWRCADALKSAGIQTSLHYPFIPGFTAFACKESRGGLDKSIAFCQRIITLPLYPTMTMTQVETVSDALIAAAC
ncbi:MAG: DegT/DnrJ/EryC1/StrS family aminotransferase [Verrucomicrobia bacterium]|nr:DegT/DnrJ/EryC1/StrS family aminotransferase [Verrucomicrobiota bacterium]